MSDRLNLHLSASVMTTVRTIAAEEGITMTEAIRRAISMLSYVHETRSRGARIFVEEGSTGKVREIEFL